MSRSLGVPDLTVNILLQLRTVLTEQNKADWPGLEADFLNKMSMIYSMFAVLLRNLVTVA